ncbi:hypothetical protein LCGC14_2198630 [marine sediment metagenome]|uniref:Uncharacterized protein n=1 Tax=marine sediment metagenome TaxID=412755 RepID=A0A0F9DHD2_9ZZZZ
MYNTKEQAYKDLEEKAINLVNGQTWNTEIIGKLSEEEQHEYHWLVEGICDYDDTECIDCKVLELDWSSVKIPTLPVKDNNEHYLFIMYMGIVF